MGLGLEDNWRNAEQYDTLSESIYYLRMEKEVTVKERDTLLALLRRCEDLLAKVPMSYPYNDLAAELRTAMYRALAAHKEPA